MFAARRHCRRIPTLSFRNHRTLSCFASKAIDYYPQPLSLQQHKCRRDDSSAPRRGRHPLSFGSLSSVVNRRPRLSPRSVAGFSSTAVSSEDEIGKQANPVEVFRKDYQPLSLIVAKMNMNLIVEHRNTTVMSEMFFEHNPHVPVPFDTSTRKHQVVLDGDESSVNLLSIFLNGRALQRGVDYDMEPGKLVVNGVTDGSVIKTIVEIIPEENTQFQGLYKFEREPIYSTQCEALGFRRITYFVDRPDNMGIFERVRLEADQMLYPVLLSNGNLIEQGILPQLDAHSHRRHYAVWSDPFPKPSYLFACVVGHLEGIDGTFTTKSGRDVQIHVYSEHQNIDKLQHALDTIKRAMKWDEDRFDLEYDLDIFNAVAIGSFGAGTMGAMENKSLNLFNTERVLSDPRTTTDDEWIEIERVVAHEYFHNWTGNRVTCRDWFQLTLKEGLTVFRDQEFTSDLNSRPVKRIQDVRKLRATQFGEDAGPLSHPIRPESYIAMDNFYTATVYEKGAEVVRMIQTLLSREGFRKGMDLYFARHDGQAVTCEDFLAAMADANDADLNQFLRWYSTPGTPTVKYSHKYDDGVFSLTLSQHSRSDEPLHMPIAVGLLDKSTGEEVVPTTVLELKEATQTFDFPDLQNDVVPSILRGFSAPVKLVPADETEDEESLWAFLAAHDTDDFNRWEAGQALFTHLILETMQNDPAAAATMERVMEAFGRTLQADQADLSMQAYALILPTVTILEEEMSDSVDPVALHKAREAVKSSLGRRFQEQLQSKYDQLTNLMDQASANSVDWEKDVPRMDAESMGRRRLRNVMLDYLCAINELPQEQLAAARLAWKQYEKAVGMTDRLSALNRLASMHGHEDVVALREKALSHFYEQGKDDPLVLNKWFSVQAMADVPDALERVEALTKHRDFCLTNPTRGRSLVGDFAAYNKAHFHNANGKGYAFLGRMLAQLDQYTPRQSSLFAKPLVMWQKYTPDRASLIKAELEKLAALELSPDLYEVVHRALEGEETDA